MRCRLAQTLLEEYLQGSLNPTTRSQLEEHLADCSDCQQLLDQLRISVPEKLSDQNSELSFDVSFPSDQEKASFIPSKPIGNEESFSPQSPPENDRLRRRLEELGVLVHEGPPSAVPDAVRISDPLQSTSDPLQHMMRRFMPPVEVEINPQPVDSGPAFSLQSSTLEEVELTEVTEEDDTRIPLTILPPPVRFDHNGRRNIPVPKELAEVDKSDDKVWIDIVITHPVTRKQILRRVRRDSHEAQRYLEESGGLQTTSPFVDRDRELLPETPQVVPADDAGDMIAIDPDAAQPVSSISISEPIPDFLLPEFPDSSLMEILEDDDQASDSPGEESAVNANHENLREDLLNTEITIDNAEEDSSDEQTEGSGSEATIIHERVDTLYSADEVEQTIAQLLADPQSQTPVTPREPVKQSNPIIRKPADIGRERLVRQSRITRDEQEVIVREPGTSFLPASAFARMRWSERTRSRQGIFLLVITVLIILLVFLTGMLLANWLSPVAQGARSEFQVLNESIARFTDILQQEYLTALEEDNYLSSFRALSQEVWDDPLIREGRNASQISSLSSLALSLNTALPLWQRDAATPGREEEAERFRTAMLAVIPDLNRELTQLVFPVGKVQWEKTASYIEPVATLARRYKETGNVLEDLPEISFDREGFNQKLSSIEPFISLKFEILACERQSFYHDGLDFWRVTIGEAASTEARSGIQYEIYCGLQGEFLGSVILTEGEGIHIEESDLLRENILAALYSNEVSFLPLGEWIDSLNHDRYLVMLPERNMVVYPEDALVVRLDLNNSLISIHPALGNYLFMHTTSALSEPQLDLFEAARRARAFLQSDFADDVVLSEERIILTAFRGVLEISPPVVWCYRGKADQIWMTLIVTEDRILQAEELCTLLMGKYRNLYK